MSHRIYINIMDCGHVHVSETINDRSLHLIKQKKKSNSEIYRENVFSWIHFSTSNFLFPANASFSLSFLRPLKSKLFSDIFASPLGPGNPNKVGTRCCQKRTKMYVNESHYCMHIIFQMKSKSAKLN